jgi:hypothetical protein
LAVNACTVRSSCCTGVPAVAQGPRADRLQLQGQSHAQFVGQHSSAAAGAASDCSLMATPVVLARASPLPMLGMSIARSRKILKPRRISIVKPNSGCTALKAPCRRSSRNAVRHSWAFLALAALCRPVGATHVPEEAAHAFRLRPLGRAFWPLLIRRGRGDTPCVRALCAGEPRV